MNRKIILTGGTGFIGSRVAARIIAHGDSPILLKRSTTDTWRIANIKDKVASYDIDKVPLETVFRKEDIDAVVNLATFYRKRDDLNDIEEMIGTNVILPTKLLQLCKEYSINRFVTAGSYFQYDLGSGNICTRTPLLGRNFYAASKNSFERMMEYYAATSECSPVSLVLFTPYGEMDNRNKLIPYIISRTIRGMAVDLTSGTQLLNLVFVDDVADAFMKSLNNNFTGSGYLRINIADQASHSVREIVRIIDKITEKTTLVNWGAIETDDLDKIENLIVNTEETKKILGWEPNVSIEEGLARTIDYYKGVKNETV